ncbi:unnamed protein product [Vicia faba]|uniref:Uncharacterized protein n=1 Tax=Vicia faba TaxID=3906 RepID=A0AAV0YNH9_VICFA|nr:unnamed protein product [Vicia faba]
MGSYLCSDVNILKSSSMDLTRVMVRVACDFILKESIEAKVDNVMYTLILREDTFVPLRIVSNSRVSKDMESDDSNNLEGEMREDNDVGDCYGEPLFQEEDTWPDEAEEEGELFCRNGVNQLVRNFLSCSDGTRVSCIFGSKQTKMCPNNVSRYKKEVTLFGGGHEYRKKGPRIFKFKKLCWNDGFLGVKKKFRPKRKKQRVKTLSSDTIESSQLCRKFHSVGHVEEENYFYLPETIYHGDQSVASDTLRSNFSMWDNLESIGGGGTLGGYFQSWDCSY